MSYSTSRKYFSTLGWQKAIKLRVLKTNLTGAVAVCAGFYSKRSPYYSTYHHFSILFQADMSSTTVF